MRFPRAPVHKMHSNNAAPQHAPPKPSLEIARSFVEILTGHPQTWCTFQIIPTKHTANVLPRFVTGPIDDLWPELERANLAGAGIFIHINETNGNGRTTPHTTAIRTFVADEDVPDGTGSKLQHRLDTLPLEPSCVVKSGRGVHLYFLAQPGVLAPEISSARSEAARLVRESAALPPETDPHRIAAQARRLERAIALAFAEVKEKHRAIQRAIADSLGTDPAVEKLAQVMRLPGTLWTKPEDHAAWTLVEIVTVSPARYSEADMVRAFPPKVVSLKSQPKPGSVELSDVPAFGPASDALLDQITRYCSKIPDIYSGMPGGGDAQAFKLAAVLLNDWALTEDEARSIFEAKTAAHPSSSDSWREDKFANALAYGTGEYGRLRLEYDARESFDFSDWPASGSTTATRLGDDTRPVVVDDHDAAAQHEALIAALSGDPSIFQRAGELVHVNRAPGQEPLIKAVPEPLLDISISRLVQYKRWDKAGEHLKPCRANTRAVSAVARAGNYPGVRVLDRIADSPVMLADGAITQAPGYYPGARILYEPSREFPSIPEAPTRDEALAAVEILSGLFHDFPFSGPEGVGKSGALSLLLTLFARPAINGPTPLFAVDASTPGAGKGLLLDAIFEIALGRVPGKQVAPTHDEEFAKVITAVARSGSPVLYLDNVKGSLGAPALDIALTSTNWEGRVLGSSATTGTLPWSTVAVATGNNLSYSGDLLRRTLPIRLESPLEKPEARPESSFRHPDLLAHVREYRAEYVAEALKILCAYRTAGSPKQQLITLGSYGAWSATVRAPLVWLGLPDPALGREALSQSADQTTDVLGAILSALECEDPKGAGLTAGEIVELIRKGRGAFAGDQPCPLADAILGATNDAPERLSTQRIGNILGAFRGRVSSGRKLDQKKDQGGRRWVVLKVGANRG